ncbi:MAG: FecR family protein [Bacteroidales bacterium]|nr:FecR family protein [Bacteroidales bacterium]MDD2424659.1 FecR family protein [Bacteroidales bacterium]MDD3989121.1 FecR family protein [Bacteroidales bacterium]
MEPNTKKILSDLKIKSMEDAVNSSKDKVYDIFVLKRDKYEKRKRHKRRLQIFSSIAAVLTAFYIIGSLYSNGLINLGDKIEIKTGGSSLSNIILPDGTRVWLNSNSKLIYPENFSKNSRRVMLYGEACFKVIKDKKHPFIVETSKSRIQVLGTTFNVKAYAGEDKEETTLLEGSIEVRNNNSDKKNKIILSPGQQLTTSEKEMSSTIRIVDAEKVSSWRDVNFVFISATFEDMINQLAKHFNLAGVEIKGANLLKTTYTGKFNTLDSIEEILDVIKEVEEFEYKIIDNKLLITEPQL